MKTELSSELLATSTGHRANEILRSCVHCGFCNATCPTYQLTGDELDGPRGRIYLIKELLEGAGNEERATNHLDRCLTCRACETTCPSGVAYGELAEIARNQLGAHRPGLAGRLRAWVRWLVPDAARLRRMARLGRVFKALLPGVLKAHVPQAVGSPAGLSGNPLPSRYVVLLNGCAQQVATPATNHHFQALLAASDIGVVAAADETCCGALDLHLGAEAPALATVRRNVDALYPLLEGAEAIVSTASGCGVTVKDYGRLLADDEAYAARAQVVADAVVDVSEYLRDAVAAGSVQFAAQPAYRKVAFQAPCSLQHGQQITGVVEALLTTAGYELVSVADSHLCCGSAGTYAILQPAMADALRKRKLQALTEHAPDVIASANVGCQSHLAHEAAVPVVHWIELLNSPMLEDGAS